MRAIQRGITARMFHFDTFHPETGQSLEVEAVYHAPIRGCRDALGVPEEPDDDEGVSIESVVDESGKPVEFQAFLSLLEEKALRVARNRR